MWNILLSAWPNCTLFVKGTLTLLVVACIASSHYIQWRSAPQLSSGDYFYVGGPDRQEFKLPCNSSGYPACMVWTLTNCLFISKQLDLIKSKIPLQNWTLIPRGSVNKPGENINPGNVFAQLNLTELTKMELGSLGDIQGIFIIVNVTNPSYPFLPTVE